MLPKTALPLNDQYQDMGRDVPQIVSNLLDDRPVRWAGGYDGCPFILEVFNVDAAEQLASLHKIRQVDPSLVIVFHTRTETARLYKDFIQAWNSKRVRWEDQEVKLGESKSHRKELKV